MGKQLGLKIVKSLNGYQEVAEINGNSSWTKNVRDTREDCKAIEGLNEDSQSSVIMYTADNGGEYYTIVSLIDGRINDFISAWIFRPWNVELSGKELLSIIESVRNEILSSEIDEVKLNKIFSKVYSESEAAVSPICTGGPSYAVRYYNKKGADYNISEIFDRGVAQKVNANYKAVFLVDCAMGLNASSCIDISSSPLELSISIYPPTPEILSSAHGFSPYLDGVVFDRPLTVIAGTEITVVWKRAGFVDIPKKYLFKEDKKTIGAPGLEAIAMWIPYNRFEIKDESGNTIPNPKIRIEKRDLPINGNLPVSEHVIKGAMVEVSCDGYSPYSGKHDLTQCVRIKLKPIIHSYRFATEGRDGQRLEFDITSRKVLVRTPLLGYHSRDGYEPRESGINVIEYRPDKVLSYKWVCIIATLLFVLGIVTGVYGYKLVDDWSSPPQVQKQPQEYKIDRNVSILGKTPNRALDNAIQYLDEHEQWIRADMETIPELRGLWDELNTFNFTSIKSRTNLYDSKRFNDLIKKIDELLEVTNNNPKFEGEKYNIKDACITIDKRGASDSYFKLLDSKINSARSDKHDVETGRSAGKGRTVGGQNKSTKSASSSFSDGTSDKAAKETDNKFKEYLDK